MPDGLARTITFRERSFEGFDRMFQWLKELMGDYFRSRRRRAGLLCLALALLLTFVWFRSDFVYDTLTMPVGHDHFKQFAVIDRRFIVGDLSLPGNSKSAHRLNQIWTSNSAKDRHWVYWVFDGHTIGITIKSDVFATIASRPIIRWADGTEQRIIIDAQSYPCWWLVLPPTLISMWLLLSRSKPPKRDETSPASTEPSQ